MGGAHGPRGRRRSRDELRARPARGPGTAQHEVEGPGSPRARHRDRHQLRGGVRRQHRLGPAAGVHGDRGRGEHRIPPVLERRAEPDPDLRAVLRAAEAAPERRDARSDSGQGKVEKGPRLPGEAVGHTEALEQVEREPQRQSHHTEKVAANPLDQRGALALDRVRAGLVERLPGRHVGGNLDVAERSKRHVGHVERVLHSPVPRHRDRRHHLMFAPLELPQHLHRFLRGRRLSEDRAPQHHRRVGPEHDGPPLARRHRRRLLTRQTRHIALGLLGRPEALVHIGRYHAELEPDHVEQLPSARRSASEDDHRSRIRVTGPSFTRSTSIMAPNAPVSTRTPLPAPRSRSSATNRSYSGTASSGGAASTKLGRRPFFTSPYSVNCDTTSTPPPTSLRARFILPSASPNTRRPSSLSAIQARLSSVSVGANPTRTTNPAPILPTDFPPMRTSARETRWTTTFTPPSPIWRGSAAGPRCSPAARRCSTRAAAAAAPSAPASTDRASPEPRSSGRRVSRAPNPPRSRPRSPGRRGPSPPPRWTPPSGRRRPSARGRRRASDRRSARSGRASSRPRGSPPRGRTRSP